MPGQSHIDRTQIQMTISFAPLGLVAFIVTPTRLKPGLSSHGPSGRNRLQSPTGSYGVGLPNPGLAKEAKVRQFWLLNSKFRIQPPSDLSFVMPAIGYLRFAMRFARHALRRELLARRINQFGMFSTRASAIVWKSNRR